MPLYKLKSSLGDIDIRLVKNIGLGGSNSIIQYESPGSDNGATINTGRMAKRVPINGTLLSKKTTVDEVYEDLSFQIEQLENIRESGEVVTLTSPIGDNSTFRFVIESFNGNYVEGTVTKFAFTMVLAEYRQANVKRAAVNLVNFQPAELLKQLGRERQVL